MDDIITNVYVYVVKKYIIIKINICRQSLESDSHNCVLSFNSIFLVKLYFQQQFHNRLYLGIQKSGLNSLWECLEFSELAAQATLLLRHLRPV